MARIILIMQRAIWRGVFSWLDATSFAERRIFAGHNSVYRRLGQRLAYFNVIDAMIRHDRER